MFTGKRTGTKNKVKGCGKDTSVERDAKYRAEQGSWILDAKKEDLVSILDKMPYGVAILGSPFGKVLYINEQILSTLGYKLADTPSTRSMMLKTIPSRRERHETYTQWKQVFKSGGGSGGAHEAVGEDGEKRMFEHHSVVLRHNLIISTWADVTRREAAEAQVRESESQFRSFFENSSSPLLLLEGDRIINCNLAAEKMLGYEKQQLVGLSPEDFWCGKRAPGRPSSSREQNRLLPMSKKKGMESQILTASGTEIPVEVSVNSIIIRGRPLRFVMLKDITKWKEAENVLLHAKADLEHRVRERTSDLLALNRRLRKEIAARKRTEQELRGSREELRDLSEYLQRIREADRVSVAREVHDQLGQSLSALKIDVAWLRRQLSGSGGELEERLLGIEEQIGKTIESVRNICKELRPALLDDLGLPVAIRWQSREFERRTGIRCIATVDDEKVRLDKDLALVIFRIFQEAMTNIMRHAEATKVRVWLRHDGNNIVLKIEDNGKGITPQQVADPHSLGIVGARERVRFWGGNSSITGRPGRGTSITVSIPLSGRKRRSTSTEGL
jgi:PAS domain S-box-containing protein